MNGLELPHLSHTTKSLSSYIHRCFVEQSTCHSANLLRIVQTKKFHYEDHNYIPCAQRPCAHDDWHFGGQLLYCKTMETCQINFDACLLPSAGRHVPPASASMHIHGTMQNHMPKYGREGVGSRRPIQRRRQRSSKGPWEGSIHGLGPQETSTGRFHVHVCSR